MARERLKSTSLLTLQQAAWALCRRAQLPPPRPPCHLPLQSISGSCMWVTQQHCSQAEEAAAELKVSGRSSERCTLLLGAAWTVLPYVLWEISEFSNKSDFPSGRKPNSFSTTSNTENKTKTLGKLQPKASALQRDEKHKVRRAGGRAGGRQTLPGSGCAELWGLWRKAGGLSAGRVPDNAEVTSGWRSRHCTCSSPCGMCF